jgi:hypothetical protein
MTGKYLLLVTGKYLAGHFTTTPFTQFGHRYSVALDPSIAQLHWYFFDLRLGSAYNVSGRTHHPHNRKIKPLSMILKFCIAADFNI